MLADLSNWPTEREWLQLNTPCAIVLIIWQLFPTYVQHHELKLWSNKANSTAEGHRFDTFRLWRPYTNLFFLLEY